MTTQQLIFSLASALIETTHDWEAGLDTKGMALTSKRRQKNADVIRKAQEFLKAQVGKAAADKIANQG